MARRFGFGRLFIILALSLLVIALFSRSRDYTHETIKLDAAISNAIRESGINEKDLLYEKQEIDKSGRHLFLTIVKHYEVGAGFDADDFLATIEKFLRRRRFNLAKSVFEKDVTYENFLISLSFKNRILYEIKFIKKKHPRSAGLKSTSAKIAIVLDDFGYNVDNLDRLFRINSPLTISVLPNLPYSRRIAEAARKHNFEVVLHLPLEPYSEELSLEEGTIMVDMPPQQVNNLLTKAIESVSGLKGISNHMGSKATEDRNLMRELFKELKERNLYFLDNLVTERSVCKEIAKSVGVRTVARSVFLDNEFNEDYIEKQIFHAAHLAEKTGWAIGVGHDNNHTIKVLTKVIPQLEKAGLEFVYVSELVR